MTFGYRSSRGGFRSPRGGSSSSTRGSFRGRGRGSDSYFRPSRGSSYSSRSSYRGSSFKGSSFHDREDYYESSRSSGSKYGHDRYGSSHNRKDEDSYHHRETRESASGSFGREHSRRSDFEPERKKMKSEVSNYKEGASPRRTYDDLEHSSRSYNISSSSYHSDSSPFKSHKKDYGEFKKPLPLEHEYVSRRPTRVMRARGGITRTNTKTIRPLMASSLKRIGTGRITRASSAARLQLLLRKKKQLRIQRLRRAREERERMDDLKHEDEGDVILSEEEEEEDLVDEEMNNEVDAEEPKTPAEPQKAAVKEIKKEPKSEPEEKVPTESPKSKPKEKSPVKVFHRPHITLKCMHCRTEYPTFKVYLKHLTLYKHKQSMEAVVFRLRKKLSRMRTEQREQQRIIDQQCDDFARTSYCKLCKLNYKQTKQEHYTSDFHVNMREFLNPECSVCSMTFQTPILYEHHRSTLAHIKRKAYLAAKKSGKKEELQGDDDNNDEDSFMVLDSVGSADESNDENEDTDVGKTDGTQVSKPKKKDSPKIVGNEYIKKVTCYYCKLCGMCLKYSPNANQDEILLSHCRTRFHLKRYSSEKLRKQKENSVVQKETKTESSATNDPENSDPEEQDAKFWTEENGDQKLSEDEEDSKSSIRYDRFGHSDGKENVDKQKTSIETDVADASKSEKSEE